MSDYPDVTVTYFGTEGADDVSVDIGAGDQGRITFQVPDASSVTIVDDVAGAPCRVDDATTISCTKAAYDAEGSLRKVMNVSAITWGGTDKITATGFGKVYGSTYTPIVAHLGGWEGNDTITALGGAAFITAGDGNDRIASGVGTANFRNSIDAGAGDDQIDASTPQSVDGIYCRSGVDTLRRNAADVVYDQANCESVVVS
ncbi:hypothetical protein [Kribbella ginsengisoli]|uniref:hypothetical protein n=1 Tax=Kribbella ginsengisoli TaxID=363865 RepID=UPI0031DE5620